MKLNHFFALLLSAFFVPDMSLMAQEVDDNGSNFYSVRPVRRADIMYLKSIWYQIDLREKMNEPFFSKNSEITKVIIDAVKSGVLRPYTNDSLNTRMPLQEFLDNLTKPGLGDTGGDDMFGGGDDWGGGGDWGGGDDWGGGGKTEEVEVDNSFFANQLYIMGLKEDVLFDKKRSKMYHDIQSITLYIPAEVNSSTGLQKPIATFSYKELVDNVFIDNPLAIWYNADNPSEHKNLADAFDLRLFSGKIDKYSNPQDAYISDIYGGNQALGLAKSQEYEYKMVEYEATLWSY